mmetsp:Transcript_75052/g.200265  ORF Transcript_75052/g.200265 Transcript_75052/m.200265 type:complete len:209 (-) Transcript_75052:1614-2240(-)
MSTMCSRFWRRRRPTRARPRRRRATCARLCRRRSTRRCRLSSLWTAERRPARQPWQPTSQGLSWFLAAVAIALGRLWSSIGAAYPLSGPCDTWVARLLSSTATRRRCPLTTTSLTDCTSRSCRRRWSRTSTTLRIRTVLSSLLAGRCRTTWRWGCTLLAAVSWALPWTRLTPARTACGSASCATLCVWISRGGRSSPPWRRRLASAAR